jgi:hypothetical protein
MMSDPDANSLQARVNKRISDFIPRDAWRSTVAIVVAKRPAVHLLGTGSLFQIADRHFVVTAAHVIRLAHEYDRTIGISGDSNSLISVHGEWILSDSSPGEDPFDVAVYLLPEPSVQRLSQSRFFRMSQVSFGEQSKTAVFTVFGHPGIWASPSRDDAELVQLKGLEYTAYSYDRSVDDLLGYNAKYHLLLDADADQVTWTDGSRVEFKHRNGMVAVFPRDLKGISGGPVWRTGDLNVPIESWHRLSPRLTGIQTGVYQPSEVIRVTRWAAVTTLIHAAFPDVRAAIELMF